MRKYILPIAILAAGCQDLAVENPNEPDRDRANQQASSMETFVAQRGPFAVFVARFIPGVRFMAGPLAGGLGMHFVPFLAANVLGAVVYVPVAVAAGYAVGYGLGEYVEPFHRLAGQIEYIVLIGALVSAVTLICWRIVQRRRARP